MGCETVLEGVSNREGVGEGSEEAGVAVLRPAAEVDAWPGA